MAKGDMFDSNIFSYHFRKKKASKDKKNDKKERKKDSILCAHKLSKRTDYPESYSKLIRQLTSYNNTMINKYRTDVRLVLY